MNKTLKICALIALTVGIGACDEGKYNDLTCDPAEYKSECLDGKYYFVCTSEQKLQKSECAAGTKCSDNSGEAVCVSDPNQVQVCTNDEKQCDGDFVKTCIQNTWVKAAAACSNGCLNGNCVDAPVVVCNENEKKCNDDGTGLLVCSGNAWGNGDSCPNGCENGECKTDDIDENACDSETDEPKCDIDGVTLLTCSENVWSPEACLFGCEEGECKEAEACDAEVDTAPKCALDNATILTCTEDVWTEGEKCANGCEDGACKDAGEDPESEPCDSSVDVAKCGEDGISLMTCSETNVWVPESCIFGCDAEELKCKDAEACDPETDTEPVCAADNATVIKCVGDVWTIDQACPNGCEDGECKESGGDEPVACDSAVDQPKCEDDNITLMTCTEDVWVSESCLFGCDDGACKDADACDVETDTAPKCALDNATVLVCTENLWTAGEKCENGCEEGVCKEGEKVCDPACENGETCIEGECVDPTKVCDSENDVPKCGGDDDAYVVTCTENLWTVAEEACPNGCENGECKEVE